MALQLPLVWIHQPPMCTVNLKHDCVQKRKVFLSKQDCCHHWYKEKVKRKQKNKNLTGDAPSLSGPFLNVFWSVFFFLCFEKLPKDRQPSYLSNKLLDPPLNILSQVLKLMHFIHFLWIPQILTSFSPRILKSSSICTLRRICNCLQESSHNETGHLLYCEGIVVFLWIICK